MAVSLFIDVLWCALFFKPWSTHYEVTAEYVEDGTRATDSDEQRIWNSFFGMHVIGLTLTLVIMVLKVGQCDFDSVT